MFKKMLYILLFFLLIIGFINPKNEDIKEKNTEIYKNHFYKAKENSRKANEAFTRVHKSLEARMTTMSDEYLFPKKIANKFIPRDNGNPLRNNKDVAGDLYGFLVLGAYYTNPKHLLKLNKTLQKEISLSNNGLPITFNLHNKQVVQENLDTRLFGASEYVKDGLLPIIELLDKTDRYKRLISIEENIFKESKIQTKYGLIPSNGVEVNGEQLQVLSRLYLATRNNKYLEWAEKIGDNYIYEILPKNQYEPCEKRNFENHTCESDRIRLRDHGNEIIPGLVELYHIQKITNSPKTKSYKEVIEKMLNTLLKYRNNDGLFYVDNNKKEITDNWGYVYYAYYLYYLLENKIEYYDELIKTMNNLGKYTNYRRGEGSMDGLADTIESALYFMNTSASNGNTKEFIEKMVKQMFVRQKGNGFIDGSYLDGNFIRTTLMYGLYKTQGAYLVNFNSGINLGASTSDDTLYLYLSSTTPQKLIIKFDYNRHKEIFRIPYNYPRINSFPEWYTIEKEHMYQVNFVSEKISKIIKGTELINGIHIDLNKEMKIKINDLSKK